MGVFAELHRSIITAFIYNILHIDFVYVKCYRSSIYFTIRIKCMALWKWFGDRVQIGVGINQSTVHIQCLGQIILITRDAFIFTPRSTVNGSTGSVLINIITFVKGKLCKIIGVIFMISFLNVIYGGFLIYMYLSVNICEIWLFMWYI